MSKFYLELQHQVHARAVIKEHQLPQYKSSKKCHHCNGDGVESENEKGCLTPCKRCVSTYIVKIKWANYCRKFPALFKEYLAPGGERGCIVEDKK